MSSSTVIPDGSSNVTITVTPIIDVIADPDETVTLTLNSGPYVIGSPSDATVTIVDAFAFSQTEANTWTGEGDWTSNTNWSLNRIPVDGDAVTINGSVVLSATPPVLSSLDVLNGGTLIISNGTIQVLAEDVTVEGIITHIPNSDVDGSDGWTPDSRVDLMCATLVVATNGAIHADSKGYAGGPQVDGAYGYGPGRGRCLWTSFGCGGGYGGKGGSVYQGYDSAYIGMPYGSAEMPIDPGSGGSGGTYGTGGAGGGSIQITAGDAVTVNGAITANGNNGPSSGGSGGGVYIVCRTFGGTNGLISAKGGYASQNNSAGGGGRIAVVVNGAAQDAAPRHNVRFNAARGLYDNVAKSSRPGTIYLSSLSLIPDLLMGGELIAPSLSNWAPGSLTVSNSLAVITNRLQIAVTNTLLLTAGGGLELPNATVSAGGNLVMNGASELFLWSPPSGGTSLWVGANMTLDAGSAASWYGSPTNLSSIQVNGNLLLVGGSVFTTYSGTTNSPEPGYGASVTVVGDVTLATNSWIRPFSDYMNGGSIRFDLNNLSILTTNAGFSADAGGYSRMTVGPGTGPGGGGYSLNQVTGGGGYGGKGGDTPAYPGISATVGGVTYGSAELPLQPGSSGGHLSEGGGLVWIVARGTATLDGTLRSNGGAGYNGSGGGSGGGIYLSCKTLAGTNGVLQANGGAPTIYGGAGGGGGGGRIAVWRVIDHSDTNTWIIQALGYAVTNAGADGTVFWGQTIPANRGTVIYVR